MVREDDLQGWYRGLSFKWKEACYAQRVRQRTEQGLRVDYGGA